ncbi:MAG: hypothetical protein WA459_16890 [Stellaceae bacterium]
MGRRLWLVGLCVYALAAAADAAVHLRNDTLAGQEWWAPDNLTVAFSAGLFWPVDLFARKLLTL